MRDQGYLTGTHIETGKPWQARTVLVYEPSHFMRRLTSEVLRLGGASQVISTGDPEEILDRLDRENAPILLSSWKPDDHEGLKLVRQIRCLDSHLKRTEILLLSSRQRLGDIEIARDAGINDYLARPFAARDITLRVDQMTRQKPSFVSTVRYQGPDRRRDRPPRPIAAKRQVDVAEGRITSMQAALNQADDIAQQMIRRRNPVGERVGRSLRHFLEQLSDLTPDAAEIIALHRSTLARLEEVSSMEDDTKVELVDGLEQIAGTRVQTA